MHDALHIYSMTLQVGEDDLDGLYDVENTKTVLSSMSQYMVSQREWVVGLTVMEGCNMS